MSWSASRSEAGGSLRGTHRSRPRRGAVLDLVARPRLRLFLQAPDDRLGDPGCKRCLRAVRGLHQGRLARALHACLLHGLSDGARALRTRGGLLVRHRLRHFARPLLLLAPDHHRRAADPVLDHRALCLGNAGEAAKHGLCHPARISNRLRPSRQAGDDLRFPVHGLPCRGCRARRAKR